MNINDFNRFSVNEICPICSGREFIRFRNSYGMKLFECSTCGGVPSYCKGEVYLESTEDKGIFSVGGCSNCGESNNPATHHSYMSLWPGQQPSDEARKSWPIAYAYNGVEL